jgi:ankyrin repeat protein
LTKLGFIRKFRPKRLHKIGSSTGKLDFLPLLLSHGADLHAEDNDKATALHAAAKEGHADVCLELLVG